MNLWRFFKAIKPRQSLKLIKLGFSYPLFVWPTLKATRRSIKIATSNYGKQHHRNTPANAFRHAIWNYFIARECLKWINKEQTVLQWTKKITDLHEDLMPNGPLARSMDLHNNAVGRHLFLKFKALSEMELVSHLKKMAQSSIKVASIEDFNQRSLKQLTHIIEVNTNEEQVL